jgi:hypothetical protein
MTLADPEPTKTIADYLRARLREGREFCPTRFIAEGTGLTPKQVGARMLHLSKENEFGLEVTLWSARVWRIRYGSKAV